MKLLCDRYVYSSHIDETFFILPSLGIPSRTDLQKDIREHIHAYSEKGDIYRKKLERCSEKLLCDVCIPLRELYLFSHKAVFEHCSCKTENVIFQSTLKTMAESEISSNKTQTEAFQETAL